MITRNWLDLSRKLVDRFDLNVSFTAVTQTLGEYALAWFGDGVVITTTYPDPFAVTLSGSDLGGTVDNGIAFDSNGQITRISPSSLGDPDFTLEPSDPSNPRYDLLCIKYVATGDTLVPKPSDPLTQVYLNLEDDFELVVIEGTPSGSPSYPAKGDPLLIVLAGIQVPAGATLGTQCTVDYTQREQANSNLSSFPVINQETPSGVINGTNAAFTLSEAPIDNTSILVRLDGVTLTSGVDWSILGQTLTLSPAPSIGQKIDVWYIVNSSSSQNPLSGAQETPSGTANGVNTLFTLSGKPANQVSTMVFVDGLEVPLEGWNLIQGLTHGSIEFNAGYIPVAGQEVYVFYLVNPFVFGVQPPPTPPSGAGALVANGSGISPQIITASVGIPATSDQRQLWFVASSGGAQTVTATPQIQAGTIIGQELYLQGTSATNYIRLQDGNGLSINGPIDLTNNGSILLVWNGSVWSEITRR